MTTLDKASTDDASLGAEELVTRAYSRCSNFPKTREGILGLAQGLFRSSQITGVSMDLIVRECADASEFCPTDAVLLSVARGLRPQSEQPIPGKRTKCPFQLCDDSGWRQAHYLHTHHAGTDTAPAWVEKELITREQFDELVHKVDWKKQLVFEGRYRCKCHPPRDESAEPAKRKRRA